MKSTNNSDGHLADFRIFYVLFLNIYCSSIQTFFENKLPVLVLKAFKVLALFN
jgi:hypothetical protein